MVQVRNKINNINVRRRGSYSVKGIVILSRNKITTVVILSCSYVVMDHA